MLGAAVEGLNRPAEEWLMKGLTELLEVADEGLNRLVRERLMKS